jgi:signal transduction histidine kinase/ligand-binding sensor domain-containing protein
MRPAVHGNALLDFEGRPLALAMRRRCRPKSLLGLGLLLGLSAAGSLAAPGPTSAAPPVDDLRAEYSIRHWTPENGLPDSAVFGVTQTTDGYLWLGTRAGVVRFDGLVFTTFERANTPALPENVVLQVAADDRGNLWAATGRGLVVRRPTGHWESVTLSGQPLATGGEPIHACGDAVWVSGPGKRWWRCVAGQPPASPRDETIRGEALGESAGGDLWWIDEGRLFHRGLADGSRREFPLGVPPTRRPTWGAFARRSDGTLALLFAGNDPARGFLHELGDDGPRLRVAFPVDEDIDGARLAAAPDGAWWLQVSPRKVLRWRNGRTGVPGFPEAEAEDVALGFHADRDGNFWVGTRWSGLYRIRPGSPRAYAREARPPTENARAVLALRDGRLAVGTDRGLFRIAVASGPGRPFLANPEEANGGRSPRDLAGHSIRALAQDRDGRLWVGTGDGLFVERGGRFESVSLPILEEEEDGDRRGSLKIRAILAARAGDLWVVAPRLVSVLASGADAFRPVAVLRREAPAAALAEDSRGRVWLALEGEGVAVLDVPPGGMARAAAHGWPARPADPCVPAGRDEPRFLSPPPVRLRATNALSSDYVWDLWADQVGGVWVACENGLNYLPPGDPAGAFPPGATFQFTRAHGLPDHRLNSFVEDGFGEIWCGTDHGVFRVRRDSLMAVVDGRSERAEAVPCDPGEAAGPIETNGRISRPGVARTDDGRLWFATTRGVIPFDPRGTAPRDRPPLVALEEVRADGETILTTLPSEPRGGRIGASSRRRTEDPGPSPAGATPFLLPPGRARVMEFRFTGLGFVDPEALVFRYRLEGYEVTWHEAGTRRVAHYTNLDPGDYRFEVLAGTAGRTWAEHPARFSFRLAPFFWQTLWFRLVVVAGTCGTVLGVVRWRVHEVRRQESLARENALLRERASIARDIHDDLGPRLTQLTLLTEQPERGPLSPSRADEGVIDPSTRGRIALLARDLANTLDGTLWTVEPTGDTLPSFAEYLIDFATDFLRASGIRLDLAVVDPVPPFPLSRALKRHLSLFAKEALNNVVKHAHARNVLLRLEAVDGGFALEIADDGRGLPSGPRVNPEARGRSTCPIGLSSLEARAEAIDGRLTIRTGPGQGTALRLEVAGFPAP